MLGERFLYTLAMIVAALLAGWMLRGSQRSLPLKKLQRFGILCGALIGAMFGAKLPFVLQHAELGMASWLSDGKTILWALTGGYVGVEIAKWALEIRVRTGDTFVVPVALAIALGRLGCLLFGCCYGTATELPWGICFVTADDGGTVARHPTQIYESAFHLGVALVAVYAIRKHILQSNLMPLYICAYAIFRFCSEFVRPEPVVYAGLTFYQLSAVPIAVAMLTIITARLLIGFRTNPLVSRDRKLFD